MRVSAVLAAAAVLSVLWQSARLSQSVPSGLAPLTSALPGRSVLRLGVATSPVPATPNSVLWLAGDLGFYAREGVEVQVTEFSSTPIVMAGLQTGNLDIGNVSTEAVLRARAVGHIDVRAIHSPDPDQHFLVVARGEISTPADLRGRSFAVAAWDSVDAWMTRLVLDTIGVDARDVHFVALGDPSSRATALRAGRVEATTVSLGTWAALGGDEHLRVILDASGFFAAAPLVSKVDAVSSRTLQERPAAVQHFTSAVIKASRYFAGNQQAWVDAMFTRRPDLATDTLAWLWQQYRGAWPVNGCMAADEYQATADFLYASQAFQDVPALALADWTARHIVDRILDEIGRERGRC